MTPQTKDADEDEAAIFAAFGKAVNMTSAALEAWLKTDESRSVGMKHPGASEAVGHAEGRRIVAIKHKKRAALSDDDLAHMRKAVGYIKRHLAQGGPDTGVETSRWRYSLMNWGHDPLKR